MAYNLHSCKNINPDSQPRFLNVTVVVSTDIGPLSNNTFKILIMRWVIMKEGGIIKWGGRNWYILAVCLISVPYTGHKKSCEKLKIPYLWKVKNSESDKNVKNVPIIFSWENLTVQTLYNPKKSFLYKKIINNGKKIHFYIAK